MSQPFSLLANLPVDLSEEVFEDVLRHDTLRIERIVSKGHSSPPNHWYDQTEHEWGLLLAGAGRILYADNREVTLRAGDCLNIPAHTRHRVSWTDPNTETIWLAIFYS